MLNGEQSRTTFLNATLFFLFVCAFVSDRWPEATTAAIVAAVLIVALQAALLLRANRTFSKELPQLAGSEKLEVSTPRRDLDVIPPRDVALTNALYLHALRGASSQRLHSVQRARFYALHVKATADLLAWTVANSREDRFTYLVALKDMEKSRPQLAELEKWRVFAQGDDAFHIAAGAFEIEHFHGKTNIRVIDASRVTVETEKRGESLPNSAPGMLRPPTYQ